MMASLEEIRQTRKEKAERLRELGLGPYPHSAPLNFNLVEVGRRFATLSKRRQSIRLAGRVRQIRKQGSLLFFNFEDGTSGFQGLVKKNEVKRPEFFSWFVELVDIGDFVEVEGRLFLTKTKEKTILVKSWRVLAKSLRPLPDKWSGLRDVEERFRRRYLDSLMSLEVRERFVFRSRLMSFIRAFLDKEGFLEVETPVLQPIPGGASAKPFVTHHEALDVDLFLRISEELYLKRWLVGGFPKVYSLARNFRNEGIDSQHNPEFTMLEFYKSFSDAAEQMVFVEKMLKSLVQKLLGKKVITFGGQKIDLGKRFKTVSYFDLFRRQAQILQPETASKDDLIRRARQLGVLVAEGDTKEKLLDSIYKKVCRPKLVEPTFIVDYPADYLPLAKRKEDNPELVDAFQLVAGGLELVKAFSELNDPLDQRERFKTQMAARAAGDEEAQILDEDFLEALEYGMPPAGGVGIGIDRLVMFLTDTKNIREVIYFPTLRPRD